MISAEEARNISNSLIGDQIAEELMVIEKCITKSLEYGYTSAYMPILFSKRTIDEVKKLGYKVTICDGQWEAPSTIVSWE